MPRERPHHGPDIDGSVRTDRDHRRRRQGMVAWIGDDAERREGQPVLGCDSSRNMGLRVDRDCPGPLMQRAFGFGTGDRSIGSRNVADRHMARGSVAICRAQHHLQEGLRPAVMTGVAAVFSDDVASDDAGAGLELRRKAAGNAEADDALATLPHRQLDRSHQLQAAAAANHRNARTRGNARLEE